LGFRTGCRAIEDYDKSIELGPNSSRVYWSRGNSYFALRQYQRSIEDFDKALELDTSSHLTNTAMILTRHFLSPLKHLRLID